MSTTTSTPRPARLPFVVTTRFGSFGASPDGRYIAYEKGSRLRVYDRSTGADWQATDEFARSHYAPVFSPDGKWLAFLRSGAVAGQVPDRDPLRGQRHTDHQRGRRS